MDRNSAHKDMVQALDDLLSELTKPEKSNILESLVTIARADGEVSEPERNCLDEIAKLLGFERTFIDGILKFLE